MKYYLSDIIPQIMRFSKQLDELTLIQNHHWIAFDTVNENKITYIFRDNKDLIISQLGQVNRCNWDYLGNKTILIDNPENDRPMLYKNSFLDETILVLNLYDTDNYAFFINESKIGVSFRTIESINEYLDEKYSIGNGSEKVFESLSNIFFTESLPESKYDIILGSYKKIFISFQKGQAGYIMQGDSSGQYFYLHNFNGRTYALDKADCIYQLYLHLNDKV